jgi:hypothetical protein
MLTCKTARGISEAHVACAVTSLLALFLSSCMPNENTPLSRAASEGDITKVDSLLAAGATPAERGEALMWAAREGQPEAIYALVKSGADPNFRAGVNDWPVLMHAIHKDQLRSVRALLNSGADANATGRRGETPLMMAAGYGYADISRLLLEHKADPYATMADGENALDFAVNGVADIDKFTWGRCQAGAVGVLRELSPNLKPKDPQELKRCS